MPIDTSVTPVIQTSPLASAGAEIASALDAALGTEWRSAGQQASLAALDARTTTNEQAINEVATRDFVVLFENQLA